MLTAFALLLSVTAVLAFLNERFFRLPTTVGVTLAGALSSMLLIALDALGLTGPRGWAAGLLETLDFTDFVLNGILSILLFAGALGLDARQLLRQRFSILTLAVFSTLLSTFLIGFAAYGIFGLVGLNVPLLWSLLFGALISPTDPVAVLDLLKRAAVPKRIETLIAGESLFNDGVGVVIFLVIAGMAGIGHSHGTGSVVGALELFGREALGGMAFGALLGAIGFLMLREIEQHAVEVLITLALVVGGYVAASALGVSGPLAMVVAGLVISAGRDVAFGKKPANTSRVSGKRPIRCSTSCCSPLSGWTCCSPKRPGRRSWRGCCWSSPRCSPVGSAWRCPSHLSGATRITAPTPCGCSPGGAARRHRHQPGAGPAPNALPHPPRHGDLHHRAVQHRRAGTDDHAAGPQGGGGQP
ncbi:sodium:proton antiporter [Deinococcus radiodurans]|nr:sodium:proton antiporter [Deinococcus radiodurans]